MQESDGRLFRAKRLASVWVGANSNASTATEVRMTVTKAVLIWLFVVWVMIGLQLSAKCASDEALMTSLFVGYLVNTGLVIVLGSMKTAD